MGLPDGLNDPHKKEMVVADCLKLMDELVASAGGVAGVGLKAGYAAIKGISPTYCAGAIERLLPESLAALDPMWSEGTQTGDPVGYLTENTSRTAEALLSVTDARSEKTSNGIVRGVYNKLRNSAKGHVEKAVPGLARVIDNYTKS